MCGLRSWGLRPRVQAVSPGFAHQGALQVVECPLMLSKHAPVPWGRADELIRA